MNKAIFLDRDGTINADSGYIHNPDELQLLDGVVEGLLNFQRAGYLLIIVTNQSGIGRKMFTVEQYQSFQSALISALKDKGVTISDTMMCPHAPEENCTCRKPSPEMINIAITKHNIDAKSSFMFGDKGSDVECGERAGVCSRLITHERNLLYWSNKILK